MEKENKHKRHINCNKCEEEYKELHKKLSEVLKVFKFKIFNSGNFGYEYKTKLKSGHIVRLNINLD